MPRYVEQSNGCTMVGLFSTSLIQKHKNAFIIIDLVPRDIPQITNKLQ